MTDDTALHILRQRPTVTARPVADACRSAGAPPARSLYVHIPFCFHKCHYCDFYSFVDTRDRQAEFVDRLCRELSALAPLAGELPLRTIFVGGGTPTMLRPELWRVLLDHLGRCFDLSEIRRSSGEFTVECNPETASEELFEVLVAGGVNRLSVGAQTFSPRHLKTLERWHDPDSVPRAIELARSAGIAHRSVDLIYAIPGQGTDEVIDDLRMAFDMPIDHISAYNLTYEPNTAMTTRLRRGEFDPADEDTELAMFWAVRRACAAQGFDAYEVSNFAREGGRCAHNLAYWNQDDWVAAGPSASAHLGGHRYKVIPRLDDYLKTDDAGFALIVDHEPPDEARALAEVLMTGLRLSEGLDASLMLRRAARFNRDDQLRAEALAAGEQGWLTTAGGRWRLTEAGLPLADHVAACLMSAVG